MGDEREGFLSRWSRLKQAHRAEDEDAERAVAPEAAEDAADPQADIGPEATGAASDGAEENGGEPLDLPPIESLDRDSDFTAFMKEGVPEELRRLALRKLWRSDPVLANLDGLVEYGEDFAAPWRAGTAVSTVYRVGAGMPDPVKKIVEEITADQPAGADARPATVEADTISQDAKNASDAAEETVSADSDEADADSDADSDRQVKPS